RAGTDTAFWFENILSTDEANYNGSYPYLGSEKGEYREKTLIVNSFRRNPWGLYQMHGNVWEWCEDVWHQSHEGADPFGQPRLESGKEGSSHVCRGGSWNAGGRSLRAACRVSWSFDDADDNNGFRLARGPE
ncbi:MAG: formylglycine-generating enzyme family protein, partial [Gammaproteobacteria bacterium]